MKKRATIKDVAEYSGVSIGTVDRVLHNRGRYSEETAALVHNAIKELNYLPNQVASTLVSMKNGYTIGVNFPLDQEQAHGRFWPDAKKGVEKAAAELAPLGINIEIYNSPSWSDERRVETIQEMVNNHVDAIVMAPFSEIRNDKLIQIIPDTIPYASAVSKAWRDNFLFHIGPDDEAMGTLIAKCVRLYCGEKARIIILAPNYELESTHKRISGFVTKLNSEYPQMEIVHVLPIIAGNFQDAHRILREETIKVLNSFPDISAIYVTNGFVKPVADAMKSVNSPVRLFGHEYFTGIRSYLEDGTITATVCQEPFKQWYQAVMTMAGYLLNGSKPSHLINADCSLLIQETVPLLSEYFFQSI